MRGLAASLCVLAVAVTGAGCSGGGGSSSGKVANNSQACTLVSRLDTIADNVAHANVADPSGFRRTLDDAVTQYATTVRELQPLVPENVRTDLERVEASVRQYRFDEAAADRTSLDEFAENACGRAPTTSAPSALSTTSVSAP